ncbi:MAG: aminotransferase class III-fold pyridoxal phosphate-dependent enzyme [Phycisphaerales bacterium]
MNVAAKPSIKLNELHEFLRERYDLAGDLKELDGERDFNCRLTTEDGTRYIIKVTHPEEQIDVLDFQCSALSLLSKCSMDSTLYPQVIKSHRGSELEQVWIGEQKLNVRVVSYLPGSPIAGAEERNNRLLVSAGRTVGDMDNVLARFSHRAMHRWLDWDSKHSFVIIRERLHAIQCSAKRDLIESMLDRLEDKLLPKLVNLPMQVIHNDVNDYNLLVDDAGAISGVIDFGDLVYSYRACDPAHALAYLILDHQNWSEIASSFLDGYLDVCPLAIEELAAVFDFMVLRLCLSVTMSAHQRAASPDNVYLSISETPAWDALTKLTESAGDNLRDTILRRTNAEVPMRSSEEILSLRERHLSATLSTSYQKPIHIVRGRGQYLIDRAGNQYLDCVNNVCHVGHCHPKVVAAACDQISRLNTNTRYLHDSIVEYARRLTATLPQSLEVCFFVNSGSEANDLALRMARTHTQQRDMIVIDHAYHGHTQSLIEISPYKFNGPGGPGKPKGTHITEFPDTYRGRFLRDDEHAGERYAESVKIACREATQTNGGIAGFIAESILGVGGQVVLPQNYLQACYSHIRNAGGVCIADEVQVGFGRAGSHMWAFETQGACPDIVTMGKPIGNGHPLAAVVTTREIADSFCNGMEYFNTFGGNPVSSRIGLAVLDVIESEDLMENAKDQGEYLRIGFERLAGAYPQIGDIRGMGLFWGIELVDDRRTKQPNPNLATQIIEHLKSQQILLSSDGPMNNVLKFKPPITMQRTHADKFLAGLRRAFAELC